MFYNMRNTYVLTLRIFRLYDVFRGLEACGYRLVLKDDVSGS